MFFFNPLISIPILFILIFFTAYAFVLKKDSIKKRKRAFISIITSIVLAPVIYVSAVYLFLASIFYYPESEFDRSAWINKSEKRYEMSKSLIDSKKLIGMTKNEVINLLGNDYYTYSENHITYYLGFVPGLSIDPDVLDVYFNNERVIKVAQHRT